MAALTACGSTDNIVTRQDSEEVQEKLEAARLLAYGLDRAAAFEAFRELTLSNPDSVAAWEGAVDTVPSARRTALQARLAARLVPSESSPRSTLALQTLHASLIADLVNREKALTPLTEIGGPDRGWPHAALGAIFRERGNSKAALGAFADAVRKTPDLARGWRAIAELYAVSGRTRRSIAAWERYLRFRPADPDALFNLAFLLVRKEDRPRDAQPYLERALTVRPDDAGILVNLGSVCLLRRDPQPDTAERCFLKALALAPRDPTVHYNLGILYADHRGAPDKAIGHFQEYLRLGGSERTRVKTWVKELKEGRRP